MQITRDYSFFIVPDQLMDTEILSSHAKLAYCVMARFADKHGKSFPSLETIAKRMGISRTIAKEAIKSLEKTKWLSHKRTGRSNIYILRSTPGDYQMVTIRPSDGRDMTSKEDTTKEDTTKDTSDAVKVLEYMNEIGEVQRDIP